MQTAKRLKVGEVAARAGVGHDTVRYYERLGVLPAAARTKAGYRTFDPSAVERIVLVKRLQELGLTLDEVRAMLASLAKAADRSTPPSSPKARRASCTSEARHLAAALRRTEEQLASLLQLQATLRDALERCDRGTCTLLPASLHLYPLREPRPFVTEASRSCLRA